MGLAKNSSSKGQNQALNSTRVLQDKKYEKKQVSIGVFKIGGANHKRASVDEAHKQELAKPKQEKETKGEEAELKNTTLDEYI